MKLRWMYHKISGRIVGLIGPSHCPDSVVAMLTWDLQPGRWLSRIHGFRVEILPNGYDCRFQSRAIFNSIGEAKEAVVMVLKQLDANYAAEVPEFHKLGHRDCNKPWEPHARLPRSFIDHPMMKHLVDETASPHFYQPAYVSAHKFPSINGKIEDVPHNSNRVGYPIPISRSDRDGSDDYHSHLPR